MSGRGPDLEISRAWLVDPATGREGAGEIVVTDGVLEAVTWLKGKDAAGIGADGVVVAPGFIDLHVHLREPGNEDAETVASGLAAAAHGGFTTVCAMPNTTPALDGPGVLALVRTAAVASGSPVELLALGAVTVGRDGERLAALGELADAGVVGFSDDGSPV
ncbi:MAG: dihydroorotase, partial [Chloroflexota bacterium]|nr:dihydroorotase [Chloroflexota bacterium]